MKRDGVKTCQVLPESATSLNACSNRNVASLSSNSFRISSFRSSAIFFSPNTIISTTICHQFSMLARKSQGRFLPRSPRRFTKFKYVFPFVVLCALRGLTFLWQNKKRHGQSHAFTVRYTLYAERCLPILLLLPASRHPSFPVSASLSSPSAQRSLSRRACTSR